MGEVNWTEIGKGIGEQGLASLKGVLEGSEADLKEFGAEIGIDAVRAVKDDRPDIGREVKEQVKLLGEAGRIRLNNATWDFVGDQLLGLAKVARVALLAGGVAL